jgi:hypothetical protein
MFNFINNINNISNTKNNRGMKMSRNIHSINNQLPSLKESKTISLFSQPYLDEYNKCYKNIVTLNLRPQGPLDELVKFIKFPQLSEFKQQGSCNKIKQCGYALMTLDSDNYNAGCGKFGEDLMVVDEVPNLISFLVSNGYSVDTSITKMFNQSEIRFHQDMGNKLICFVTYNG